VRHLTKRSIFSGCRHSAGDTLSERPAASVAAGPERRRQWSGVGHRRDPGASSHVAGESRGCHQIAKIAQSSSKCFIYVPFRGNRNRKARRKRRFAYAISSNLGIRRERLRGSLPRKIRDSNKFIGSIRCATFADYAISWRDPRCGVYITSDRLNFSIISRVSSSMSTALTQTNIMQHACMCATPVVYFYFLTVLDRKTRVHKRRNSYHASCRWITKRVLAHINAFLP